MPRPAKLDRLQKVLRSLTLDKKTLGAKKVLAHETARFLILSRDLMNAHFLAQPVFREDVVSDGLHVYEDDKGFYSVQFSHFTLPRRA